MVICAKDGTASGRIYSCSAILCQPSRKGVLHEGWHGFPDQVLLAAAVGALPGGSL